MPDRFLQSPENLLDPFNRVTLRVCAAQPPEEGRTLAGFLAHLPAEPGVEVHVQCFAKEANPLEQRLKFLLAALEHTPPHHLLLLLDPLPTLGEPLSTLIPLLPADGATVGVLRAPESSHLGCLLFRRTETALTLVRGWAGEIHRGGNVPAAFAAAVQAAGASLHPVAFSGRETREHRSLSPALHS